MKKSMKILSVLLMIALLAIAISPMVLAAGEKPSQIATGESNVDTKGVTDLGNSIIKIIRYVGMFAAVIIIMVIGIKYMTGSAEEKAEYKKVLIPYLIGAVLLFGAAFFADKIYDWAQNLFQSGN